MRSHSKSPVRVLTFILIAAMAVFILFASRHERASSLSSRQKSDERQKAEIEKVTRNKAALPRAEYEEQEPEDPALRQLRKARDKRYHAITSFEDLHEGVTELPRVTHETLEIPGLPVEQSDLIVVGTITDAKGYVTKNRSSAYSEYSIEVSDVLKGATKFDGSQITAERFGAKVVLPSGRTILVWDAYSGTPEMGHRYVLFLKYSPEGQDYLIVTAYDLRNGRVMSIDRLPQCAFFDGNEETAFLDLVRSSVK